MSERIGFLTRSAEGAFERRQRFSSFSGRDAESHVTPVRENQPVKCQVKKKRQPQDVETELQSFTSGRL